MKPEQIDAAISQAAGNAVMDAFDRLVIVLDDNKIAAGEALAYFGKRITDILNLETTAKTVAAQAVADMKPVEIPAAMRESDDAYRERLLLSIGNSVNREKVEKEKGAALDEIGSWYGLQRR